MGWTYCGVYADLIGAYDAHEGYAARILPDGTETATWTVETHEFTGYRSCCECGWRGTETYLPTERGEKQAEVKWDRDHVWPMVRNEASKHTVPATMLVEFARGLRDLSHMGSSSAARGLDQLLDTLARIDDPWWPRGDR